MDSDSQLAFIDARGGMNAADPPHRIGTNQVARMVNCAIVDGVPTTRLGARAVPLDGGVSEYIGAAAFQGSCFYNPAKGQGGLILAESNSSLAVVFGGRKFLIGFTGRRGGAKATARDITAGLFGNPQTHLAWLAQWENLLIIADGQGKTFIYSPDHGASFSGGYNIKERLKSQIPNGATVLTYAHGRGVAVVNSRNILVGDSLHQSSLTTSDNLIAFTDQTYWATGQYFLPPSSIGGINAASPLPLKNTQHGHGDLMLHCEDGVFSLDLNQYPRSNWANLQLVKLALLQAGATGPYAVACVDGDQIYRTRKGAQTLRSAAATASLEGNPEHTLSPEVDTWFSGDYPRWLRFASVNVWDAQRRIFFTVSPIVQGRFRWNRGLVVRNTDTAPTSPNTPAVWEGLWTLPPEMCGVVQLVNGLFDGEERQFAWTRGDDGQNRLVEFSPAFRDDVLPDGSRHPIRCQVQTRAIDAGEWWKSKEFVSAKLYFRNIAGRVRWGVWYRPDESPAWKPYKAGTMEVPDFTEDAFDLRAPAERSIAIPLGVIPGSCQHDSGVKANQSRSMQFLVRWEGYCSFEGIKVKHAPGDLSSDDPDPKKLAYTFLKPGESGYDDFEYSFTNDALWIEQ